MMMIKSLWKLSAETLLMAGAIVVSGPAPVQASVQFTLDNYTVTANNTDPGLLIETASVLSQPYQFTLNNVGESLTVALFDIWTNEEILNLDDYLSSLIDVAFSFTSPPPAFGSDAEGETVGSIAIGFLQTQASGEVEWDGPVDLAFGPNNDGILRIELSDETFNTGPWSWFNPTPPFGSVGATVDATFTLVAVPTSGAPEPTAFLVWGGLAMAAMTVGRRSRRVA